ncbi:MAG: hypothetical protein V3576_04135 [Candidatus Cloacimonadota bacterium]
MRKSLLVMLLLLLGTLLLATDLDDELRNIYSQSEITEHEDDTVLMGDGYLEDESSAYEYVAVCCMMILYAREGWEDFSSSNSWVNRIDSVAAAWTTEYQDFVVEMPIYEIRNQFEDADENYDTAEELLDAIRSYVEYHGDVSPLSMW